MKKICIALLSIFSAFAIFACNEGGMYESNDAASSVAESVGGSIVESVGGSVAESVESESKDIWLENEEERESFIEQPTSEEVTSEESSETVESTEKESSTKDWVDIEFPRP